MGHAPSSTSSQQWGLADYLPFGFIAALGAYFVFALRRTRKNDNDAA
jgi:hypothetical protein